ADRAAPDVSCRTWPIVREQARRARSVEDADSFKRSNSAADERRRRCPGIDSRARRRMGDAEMLRKWFGVAVLAVWGAQATTASAQSVPTPFGAARLLDPMPMKPTIGPDGKPINKPPPGPDLVQGPISPEAAPPGPGEDLMLPTNHSSAFQAE